MDGHNLWSPGAGKEQAMDRRYMVYQCPNCGHERKTSMRIYKFDEDYGHYESYINDGRMIKATDKAKFDPCPKCGSKESFTYVKWSMY
jgi:predicted RNA-binding Zn-ribbon protein involved in translation (DUF1610 family)